MLICKIIIQIIENTSQLFEADGKWQYIFMSGKLCWKLEDGFLDKKCTLFELNPVTNQINSLYNMGTISI